MVIIDTSLIIDHLRQPLGTDSALIKLSEVKSKEVLAISVITVQELYEGKSARNKDVEQRLLSTIGPLKTLPYTYEVAQKGGELARDLGRPIDLADAAIAATAIINGAQLFTLNKKDFEGIDNLELLPPLV